MAQVITLVTLTLANQWQAVLVGLMGMVAKVQEAKWINHLALNTC